jgi:hypothetical protein
MATNGKPFLFYSNMCHHSSRLINRIKPTNLANNLNFICIDNPQLNIPKFITSVPTLYDPNIGRPITDNELFNWVDTILGNVKSAQPQYNNPGGMQHQSNNQNNMQPQYPNQGGMNPGMGNNNSNDPRKRLEEMVKSDRGMVTMGNGDVNMADITGDEYISAFQPNEMLSGGIGTGYSFIDTNANDNLNGNFIRLSNNGQDEDINWNKNSHLMASITKANNTIPGQMNHDSGNKQQNVTSMAYDKLLADRNSERQNSMGSMRM